MRLKHLLFATGLLFGIQSYAQTGVAINTTGAEPDNSAMLDVSGSDKGILIPRMTETQRTAIGSPAKGLLVYQNDGTEGFYYYTGSSWTRMANGIFTETDPVVKAINGIVKSDGTTISAAIAGNDYLAPTGSASGLTNFPALNQNTTGTAANVTGVVAIANGGTGQSAKTAAFNALSPMSAAGDIIYGGTAGTGTRLAKGTAGQVLTMNAGATAPVWTTPTGGTVTSVSGTLPVSVSSGTTTPQISISAATTSAAGSMSSADKSKLDGIATNANNYIHPAGDGNLHVPATETINNGKVLTAGSSAGSLCWTSLPAAPVTSVAGKTGVVTLVKGDVGLANVENTALSTWVGTSNINTLGTIATGTWQGTTIADTYIGNLSASKITSGTLDNARINWAAPGNIGSTTRASGAFTSVNANNGLTVSNGTINLKPAGDAGASGEVLTTDGSGNVFWDNAVTTTLGVRFIICVDNAAFPQPSSNATGIVIGQIILWPGSENYIPKNFLPCDGRLLNIADYVYLFSLFGTAYGGDGTTTFALPNFSNKAMNGQPSGY